MTIWPLFARLWAFLVGPTAPDPNPGPPSTSPVLAAIEAINAARAAHGLLPLRESSALGASAQSWAAFMAGSDTLTHGDFEARISAVTRAQPANVAENIAEGYPLVDEVVAGWLASPPHRLNVLGPYAQVGVGCAADRDGFVYWCADFLGPVPR